MGGRTLTGLRAHIWSGGDTPLAAALVPKSWAPCLARLPPLQALGVFTPPHAPLLTGSNTASRAGWMSARQGPKPAQARGTQAGQDVGEGGRPGRAQRGQAPASRRARPAKLPEVSRRCARSAPGDADENMRWGILRAGLDMQRESSRPCLELDVLVGHSLNVEANGCGAAGQARASQDKQGTCGGGPHSGAAAAAAGTEQGQGSCHGRAAARKGTN